MGFARSGGPSGGGSGRGYGMRRVEQSLRDILNDVTVSRPGFPAQRLMAGAAQPIDETSELKQGMPPLRPTTLTITGGGGGGIISDNMSLAGGMSTVASVAATTLRVAAPGANEVQETRETNLMELAQAFELGVKTSKNEIGDMQVETFIGSDAVDWLLNAEFASSRSDAEKLGQQLLKEINLFEHVPRGMDFFDDYRFYRFTDVKQRTYPEGHENYTKGIFSPGESPMERSREDIENIGQFFRSSVKTRTHYYRNAAYHKCFIGSEAVDWIIYSSLAQSRREAVQLGQRLGKELGLFRHVKSTSEKEQGFKDDRIFYRFADDVVIEEEPMDSASQASSAEPVAALTRQFPVDAEKKQQQRRMSTIEAFEPEPAPAEMMTQPATGGDFGGFVISREERMAYLGYRLRHWASSFRRLDPRKQILDFFSLVKQIRDDNGVEKDKTKSLVMRLHERGVPLSPRLFFTTNASIFTIWRPTSLDAIRKMMMGQAVGKGLDIKGKSAKRGKLSAFVPFLQISENHHKEKIRPLRTDGFLRLFFSTAVARDSVALVLEKVGEEMVDAVAEAKDVLQRLVDDPNFGKESAVEDNWEEVQKALGCEMDDPTIIFLDEYSPHCFGLEVPVRLFWEAFIVRQDISRPKGSKYDTGHPSIPAFQDKNFEPLLAPPKEGAPRTVLWQNANPEADSSMNPLELLMAYEEHNRVYPVVSDFDAFLVGSQRVSFHRPIPDDQIEVLKWCVNRVEDILNAPGPESWTSRWLEVLENPWEGEDIHPVIPRFGFGDPVSYSIMEKAANRLCSGNTRNGAVRHGAECFNYYFPQELDDEFLVISEHIPGRKEWEYMDAKGVQAFLAERIKDGYTFPLNPKWILADGWGKTYDQLMASDRAEVQEALATWFPPESNIRQRIKEIREKHPRGFVRQQRARSLADVDPSILADILACDASNALPGTSSATGVTALLATLKPGNGEEVISNATAALASLLQNGPIANDRATELGKAMVSFLFCLEEFLVNPRIQLSILCILEALVKVDLSGVIGDGAGFRAVSILKAICDALGIHGADQDLVEYSCRLLNFVIPDVHDNTIDAMKSLLGPALKQVLEIHIRRPVIQNVGFRTMGLLCGRNDYFKRMLIDSNGIEMIVRSMESHDNDWEIQRHGCNIISGLSSFPDGKRVIGDRGGVDAVVRAMQRHPESTGLQNEALTTLKNLATVASNKPLISGAGAEDAVLYSIWINLGDAQVVTNALKAMNNIACDPRTRSVAKMRALTFHIVLVAMQRYQMNGNVQKIAVFLLKSYSFLPENLQTMIKSLDSLIPLLFSAAENYPESCRSVAESIMLKMEKMSLL